MRNLLRAVLLVGIFGALSFAPSLAGCGWLQKHGAELGQAIGCAFTVARDIANAVHAGKAQDWADTAVQGFAGAQDALGCAASVTKLVLSEHACAGLDGASCDAIPADERQRLETTNAIARSVAKLRARRELVPR